MIQGDRELIDAYLLGSMPPAERLVFETRLQTDSVLKKETDTVLLVLPLIHEAGRMSLKTQLRAIETSLSASFADYSPAKNDKGKLQARGAFSFKWWWIAVAAGMIAAAVTWYVFFYQPNHEDRPESPDSGEQMIPAQPAIHEAGLRRIADSLYADSCTKDSILKSSPVSSDTTSAAGFIFGAVPQESKQGGSKAKKHPAPGEGNSFTMISTSDSSPLYSAAWQIHDKAIIPGADVKRKKPVVISVESKTRNPFHYRFTDDTLTLYGPFIRSLLFYDQSGDRLVLRYKEKYYPLPPAVKIKLLTEEVVLGITKPRK